MLDDQRALIWRTAAELVLVPGPGTRGIEVRPDVKIDIFSGECRHRVVLSQVT